MEGKQGGRVGGGSKCWLQSTVPFETLFLKVYVSLHKIVGFLYTSSIIFQYDLI